MATRTSQFTDEDLKRAAKSGRSPLKNDHAAQPAFETDTNPISPPDNGAQPGTLGDMAKLAVIAEELSARLILSGDYKQHQPVPRGLPFRLLQTQAGIVPQEVTTIRRQQGAYKDAVELFAQGDVVSGIEKLDQLGFVREIQDDVERNKQLASDYADAIQAKQSSLVVAPAHAERDAVVTAIRDELKSRGLIDQNEREVAMLRSKRLTEAERKDPMNYSPGDVIEFSTKGKGGFKAGDRLIVAERAAGRVLAKGRNGLIDVPVDSPKSFDVFRSHQQMFAKGDGIRITKNRRPDRNSSDQRLNNGSTFTLEGFAGNGDLKLSNGQTIAASWGHIDNSATITSFAAQGKTFDRVFVAQSSLSFPASSPEQAYVSASRGRKSVSVYTDDKVALKAAVSRVRPAMNASDLVANDFARADVAIAPAKKRAEQICLQAHRFAVRQIERFKDWMQSHQQQPRYAR